jgi:hypothetical protein
MKRKTDLPDLLYPEKKYFKNEEFSDVIFVIEGKRLPAKKDILSFRNKVFRVMFNGKFTEAKAENVVIEETTFEAFHTMIWYLYSDQLEIKNPDDFKLIDELLKLGDRYEAFRMIVSICAHLAGLEITLENFESIMKIAFDMKRTFEDILKENEQQKKLMDNVKDFMRGNFKFLMKKKNKELVALSTSTDGRLIRIMADKYRHVKRKLDCFKKNLSQVKQWRCRTCHFVNDELSGYYAPCKGTSCTRRFINYCDFI